MYLRGRLWVVAGLIVIGALFAWGAGVREAVSDPVPLTVAFPAPGDTLSDSVEVRRGGRFVLEIVTPITSKARIDASRSGDPVRCRIDATIAGSDLRLMSQIKALEALDWTDRSVTWVSNDHFTLPRHGDYVLSVKNVSSTDPIFARGAFVRLTRLETDGIDLLPMALRVASYVTLAVAILILLTTDVS